MSVYNAPSNSISSPPQSRQDASQRDGYQCGSQQRRRVFVHERVREFELRAVDQGNKRRYQAEEGRSFVPSHRHATQETSARLPITQQCPPSRIQPQGHYHQCASMGPRVVRHDSSIHRVSQPQDTIQARTHSHAHPSQRPGKPGHSTQSNDSAKQSRQLCPTTSINHHSLRHCATSSNCHTNGPSQGHPISAGGGTHVRLESSSTSLTANHERQDQVGRPAPFQNRHRPLGLIQRKTLHARSDSLLPVSALRSHNKDLPSRNVHLRYLQRATPHNNLPGEAQDGSSHATMQQLQREAFHSFQSLPSQEAACPGTSSKTKQHQADPSGSQTSQATQSRFSPFNGRLPGSSTSTSPQQADHKATSRGPRTTNVPGTVSPARLRRRSREVHGTQAERTSCKTRAHTESRAYPSDPGHANQPQDHDGNQQNKPLQHSQSVSNYTRRNRNRRDMQQTVGTALCSTRSAEAIVNGPSESNKKHCSEDALVNAGTTRGDHSGNVSAASQPVRNRQVQLVGDPSESSDSDGDGDQTAFLKSTIKIVHWNAQGANTKRGRIKSTILHEKIDIMLIQDTRLEKRSDGRPPIKIPGYHTFYKAKSLNCHGLLTIVRSNLAADEIDIERPGEHSEILTVKIWINKDPLLIHNIYRIKGNINLVKLLTGPTPAFIGTDINAKHVLWHTHSNADGRRIVKQLEELDNYVILNENQHATTKYDTAIDITVLHSSLAAHSQWEVMSSLASDHFPICTTIATKKLAQPQRQQRWMLHRADWPAFQRKVELLLTQTNITGDINQMAHTMTDILVRAANDHIPKTTSKSKVRMYWCYDPSVQAAKRLLNRAIKRFRARKDDNNKQAMHEAGETYETACNLAKNTYWNKWITEVNDCITPKQLWRKIKRSTGTDQLAPKHPYPQQESNRILSGFVERSASTQLPVGPPPCDVEKLEAALRQQSRADRPIHASEISAVLKKAKQGAPGEDCISYEIMKHVPQPYLSSLAQLYTKSLMSGTLPDCWKKATIVPIPKKDKGSYRPISLLPIQSKIMEKIMLQRIRWIADPPHTRAMGFKPASGTRDAVATLVHDLSQCQTTNLRCKSRKAAAVFLDLKQAFELANKNVIISELIDAGVSGSVLAWCQDFLTGRSAALSFQGSKSDTMNFENGTPQGSTLSPCFFNYAMNTFLKLKFPAGVKVITYADDIVLYCHNYQKPMEQLQAALDMMSDAARNSGFLFAPAKSKAMWFFGKNPNNNLQVGNLPVDWVSDFHYLGVVIDKHIRFHRHAQYIVDRTNAAANALKVLSSLSGVNCFVLRRIFNATVRAILDYGSEIHNLMSRTQLNSMQRAQNSALRNCLGVHKWTPIDNIHSELDILPVTSRTEISHAKFVDKVLKNIHHPLHIYLDAAVDSPYTGKRHLNSWVAKSAATYKKLTSQAPVHHREDTPPAAPWHRPPITCNTNIEIPTKDSVSDTQLKTLAENSIVPNGRPVFYTDGSVQNTAAGAGVVHGDSAISLRLNDRASILQAELAAINIALEFAKECNMSTALIITDSKSAVSAIDTTTPKDNTALIRNIHTTASHLTTTPEILWVPAHVGVQGNERADVAAKAALNRPSADIRIHTSQRQVHTYIKKTATDIYYTNTHHQPSRSVARNQEITLSTANQKQLWKLPRNIQKDIFKLRTFSKTYKQITEGHDQCHYCDYDFSVYTDHFLTECPANKTFRDKLLTDNMHHITCTSAKVRAILHDQAQHNHKTLTQLLTKFPISQ